MKTNHYAYYLSILFICFSCLFSSYSFAQTLVHTCRSTFEPRRIYLNKQDLDIVYNTIYTNFVKERPEDKPKGMAVNSKNPAYQKVYIYPKQVYRVNPDPDNLNKSQYLHMALIEYAPNPENKKEEIVLFFSDKYMGFKKGIEKDIVVDIDNNPIVLTTLHNEVALEAALGYTQVKSKLYGTTTYIYDVTSFHPDKKPLIIGKLFQYKPNLQSPSYNEATLINYNAAGKLVSRVHHDFAFGGNYADIHYVQYYDEKEQLKSAGFDFVKQIVSFQGEDVTLKNVTQYEPQKIMTLGLDIKDNKPFFTTKFLIPYGIRNKWSVGLAQNFNANIDLLAQIKQSLGKEPDANTTQLQQFLTNYHKLDELVIEDKNQKVKYIYRGTYNKDGVPEGWGLMYALVHNIHEEYYLGQFKNGMPDGIGIRRNFKLDQPDTVYHSSGLHVGNTLIYGSRTTNDNWGYHTAHGDHRLGSLNGDGIKLSARYDDHFGEFTFGNFEQDKLHGIGQYYAYNAKSVGEFSNGNFTSGQTVTDKFNDSRYRPGAVITFQGEKRVIMKKEKGHFVLDNGKVIPATENIALTGEYSVRNKVCNMCGGTGYLQPTNKTIFSGTTQKTKTYETGPTGYILWEKTTTTTTAPVTVSKINRCSCLSGSSGSEPAPLNNRK